MTAMTFSDDMARIQRAVSQCHDAVLRRSVVMEALQLRDGERVLEIGSGGGFYASEAAQCVGPTGQMHAIDISADQVAAAQSHCSEFPWFTCQEANAVDLPYGDGAFDVVYGVQVFEYVTPLDAALSEVHRVLRPGGRCVIFATDWNTAVWYSPRPELMQRVLTAWATHSPTPNLPSILAPQLRQAGLEPLRQSPVSILNQSYHQHSFSYWVPRLIQAFVVGRQVLTDEEAEAWLQDFETLEKQGANFFCITGVLTEAVKVT